ncbi:MAG: dihydroorotate dehydrogenase electron transfer subunit [Deltaproteobacteria bacterium]|nr:dihydroorotate dehydrogenase electron transfer subunit [Deltaproteobacteria bacterium]
MEPMHCGKPRPRQVVVPLLRRDSIGASHHVLTFDCEQPLEAAPGQFAMVRGAQWGESPFLPRPMSILTAGRRPSILVKVVGEGTRRLASSEPGELFTVHAPLGVGWAPCPEDRVPVLVAGGVGVCPLVFLARGLTEQGRRAIALYGGRSAGDLPLDDELAEVTDLRIATEDGSLGQLGRVTVLLESAIEETKGRLKVYACGPRAMMARVVEMCRAADAPCEVSLETIMGCGYGVCLGCAVPKVGGGYLYACSEGPCVDGHAIAWES